MSSNDLITKAQVYFPDLQIKFKDESTFMKVLGKLMFFNPAFMTNYLTTFGDTVYIPNRDYITKNSRAFNDVFIHECTHMLDEKRLSLLYVLGYAFPQILSPVAFLALVFFSWKIALIAALFFLLPLPAPGRAHFEQKAYFVQLYVDHQLNNQDIKQFADHYLSYFRGSNYYWMWIFEKSDTFSVEADNIIAGSPSCAQDPALFNMVNDLIAAAKK